MPRRPTIAETRRALVEGTTTSLAFVERCLAAIDDPDGEGARAFLAVDHERAREEARTADRHLQAGSRGALTGIPISIKDLFDVAGEVTTCGSIVLRGQPPAMRDAPAIARLRAAGAIVIGRTNMVEFAYSGIGCNPHYGTPSSPYDRATGRAPGGSSSGGAVSVSDGMALAAIGTDTGGSVRIPAAFCGIVGFKPTRGRIPTEGVFPLAPSFDTVGPMANTVADCRLIVSVMSGDDLPPTARAVRGLRLGLATGLPLADLDPAVAAAFARALDLLRDAGATLEPLEVDWDDAAAIMQQGRITAVECLATHGGLFDRCAEYDPRIVSRIAAARGFPTALYEDAIERLRSIQQPASRLLATVDALVMPTVACIPPPLSALADDAAFFAANARALRNTMLVNLIDGCAASLPIGAEGEPPVGLSVVAGAGRDRQALDVAEAIEGALRRAPWSPSRQRWS